MKTPYQYIIKPAGERYNNEKDGLIVNATMDETDFKYTNRIGEVVALPVRNEAKLKVGDKVIVHHNTFRKWFNVKGLLKDSSNFVTGNLFNVGTDMMYAYDRGEGWTPIEDWIFVKPIDKHEEDLWNLDQYETQVGVVKIANKWVGKKVFFDKMCEYKFEIDGEIIYRMREYDLQLVL